MVVNGLTQTRSQAESWIKLGRVRANGRVLVKPGFFVDDDAVLELRADEQYVSRAGLKLASVADKFGIDFSNKVVLDVGSSTGGFTDYALQHGASLVYDVDVGTDQLHPSLRGDRRIELHERTDIRDFLPKIPPDIIVIDVSFISLRKVLPHIAWMSNGATCIYAMVKPQFEGSGKQINRSGIVKNDSMRRSILKEFEQWAKERFIIQGKADSEVRGAHGNLERFYWLLPILKH